MDLVERYLAAIERGLPSAQAADIKAELRDVLLSRIEEQEERLGRPLAREELEALLVEFGHPLVVSARYRKIQHLIGPKVFPFWWAGLKTTLSIVAGVYLVLIIVEIAAGGHGVLDRRLPSLWTALLVSFAVVTLVGVAIELYTPARILQQWKPSQLPPPGRKTPPYRRSRSATSTSRSTGRSARSTPPSSGTIRRPRPPTAPRSTCRWTGRTRTRTPTSRSPSRTARPPVLRKAC